MAGRQQLKARKDPGAPGGSQHHSWRVSLSGGNRAWLLLPETGRLWAGMLRAPGAVSRPLSLSSRGAVRLGAGSQSGVPGRV